MLIKNDNDLKYEVNNNLEKIIKDKKQFFFQSLSAKSLENKMVKQMVIEEGSLNFILLLPFNLLFLTLSILSQKAGFSNYISTTLFILGIFFFSAYFLPFVRKFMLNFFNNKAKEDLKNKIFNNSVVDNDIIKVFIKKYGKEVLAEMMVNKNVITYNDIYNYDNNVKQKKYKKVYEVIECIEKKE